MSHTILAIDDSNKILDILRHFLEGDGYQVKTSTDPVEGLKIAQEGGVDLILLDIMMPGMDGYTVFDNLKKNDNTRDVPVIMLTAKAIILHTPKDFFYGLYGFLAKPFSKQQLLKVVAECLKLTDAAEQDRIIRKIDGDEGESEEAPPEA